MLSLCLDTALFVAIMAGSCAPFIGFTRNRTPLEDLSLAVAAGLLAGFLLLFGLYLGGASLRWFLVLPIAGVVFAAIRRRPLETFRDELVRSTLAGWAVFAVWCLGWQAMVVSYSGASWHGDWIEHFDRSHFFLARWPKDVLFLDIYPLPSRPPLFNLWTAGLMGIPGGSFHHYQTFATLLNSIVFLPCALLVSRWKLSPNAGRVLLLLLMVNPFVIQNMTFPWTKIASAFFVLLAVAEMLAVNRDPNRRIAVAALLLGGGLLTHYSAAPWIFALGIAWACMSRFSPAFPLGWRQVAIGGTVGTLIFAPWLAWSLITYGVETTFTQNSTVAIKSAFDAQPRLVVAALNAFHTVWPVSIPGLDHPLLQQTSPLGQLRDWWFLHYQLKLVWSLGVAGGASVVWLLYQRRASPFAGFFIVTGAAALALGSLAHASPDQLGLTHVILHPLVFLGVVFLAANLTELPRWGRALFTVAAIVDLVMGVVLHFGVQSFKLAGLVVREGLTYTELIQHYTPAARAAWLSKQNLNFTFLADRIPFGAAVTILLLCAVAACLVFRRKIASPHPSPAP